MDNEGERIQVRVPREVGEALMAKVGIGQQPPHHQRVQAVAKAAALQDVNNVFREYEEFLRQRPWRDKGELAQLQRAKQMMEILASGAVALKTQDNPDEVTRLEQALSTARIEVTTRTRELGTARLELSQVRTDLGNRVVLAERAAEEALWELNKANKLIAKLSARLTKARARARGLGATLTDRLGQLETIKLLASSIITTAEVTSAEVPNSPVASDPVLGIVYTEGRG